MADKEWGLVDCTSIVLAKEMGIHEIFTTDHHFEQAGFSNSVKVSERRVRPTHLFLAVDQLCMERGRTHYPQSLNNQ